MVGVGAALFASAAARPGGAAAAGRRHVLRVCADPNNLPLSNDARRRLREQDRRSSWRAISGGSVEYTYFPQRMGFVRNTLRQKDRADAAVQVRRDHRRAEGLRAHGHDAAVHALDVRAGVSVHARSSRACETADDLLKLPPETLRTLRIGVFGRSPGADWLLRNDLLDRAVVYAPQSGDPAENPAHIIERDLAAGKIDLGDRVGTDRRVSWCAGTPASRRGVPCRSCRIARSSSTTRSRWACASARRNGKTRSTSGSPRTRQRCAEILASFRVPLLDADGKVIADFRTAERLRAGGVPKHIPLQIDAADSRHHSARRDRTHEDQGCSRLRRRQAARSHHRRSRRAARRRSAGRDQGHRHLSHRRVHALGRGSRRPVPGDLRSRRRRHRRRCRPRA